MSKPANNGVPTKHAKQYLKIILVGDSGVGKTCLISSYFKQSFDKHSIPTVAPAYSCSDVKRKDGKTISLQIWDTAGQERYHSVSKLFFRDSALAFICFECGDEASTQGVPNWIKRVYDEVPQCQLFLVLTKTDLREKEKLETYKQEALDKFKEYNIKGIFLTSALTREGVSELFTEAAELFVPTEKTVTARPSVAEEQHSKPCC